MFTGIIEEIGIIKNITKKTSGVQFKISAIKIMDDLKIGDSIAINGVCLTVVSYTKKSFSLDLVNETLEKSNLGDLKKGDNVNQAQKIGEVIQSSDQNFGLLHFEVRRGMKSINPEEMIR